MASELDNAVDGDAAVVAVRTDPESVACDNIERILYVYYIYQHIYNEHLQASKGGVCLVFRSILEFPTMEFGCRTHVRDRTLTAHPHLDHQQCTLRSLRLALGV